jgi:hypothetical protein
MAPPVSDTITTNQSLPESMEIEPIDAFPPPPSPKGLKTKKEWRFPSLLKNLHTFFQTQSRECPHDLKRTMPASLNQLYYRYHEQEDKPCTLSVTCFRRLWKEYFRSQFVRAKHRDGLCQLCEIGHKLRRFEKAHWDKLSDKERALLRLKLNIVREHHLANEQSKLRFKQDLQGLTPGSAVLVMDFKENITLGGGPRELGNSWYTRERRTIFGLALYTRSTTTGQVIKRNIVYISNCLSHDDAVFVRAVLENLFASKLWLDLKLKDKLSVWSDNAPHFRNRMLPAFLRHIVRYDKDFKEITFNYSEPYHGKSEVDGFFGTITKWLQQWKIVNFLNSTEDVLNCFHESNRQHVKAQYNIFQEIRLSPELWKHNYDSIGKRTKNYNPTGNNYYVFHQSGIIDMCRYKFVIEASTGKVEFDRVVIQKISSHDLVIEKIDWWRYSHT